MDTQLIGLISERDVLQKSRIRWGNRLKAIERGSDLTSSRTLAEEWYISSKEREELATKQVTNIIQGHVMYDQIIAVKGIGPVMAARVLSEIDITRPNTVSGLWRFAGYAVINGQRERPTKGERLHYNKGLKSTMYLVATQFFKSKSPYAEIYYEWKKDYIERREWKKNRAHLGAIRKMNRVFLEHLWRRWREEEGLPAPEAYVFSVLGHSDYMKASDFGWP